jgi:nicotinate phosphoribosyltransferase
MTAPPVPDNMTSSALFTDLYELTMMQAYLNEGLTGTAVFSLFARRLPPERNFLIACGVEQVLDYLEGLRFNASDIDYLASLGLFTPEFLAALTEFRFTGDAYAVPEGTPIFGNEPIVEIVAPLPEAQLVETMVLNQVHLQTLLASKAARVVMAADGRPVVDFGSRRTHGTDAGIKAARAFHIAGVTATSNVAAGAAYGLPLAGTMAHSYVEAHDTEEAAFRAFLRIYPGTTLLIDTYDTVRAARLIAEMPGSPSARAKVSAVRLDSGDLGALSREVRAVLDQAGLRHVRILASGGLDEYEVSRLAASGAPIDSFGVGTAMGVSADRPSLDMAYKLVEYEGRGCLKLSTGKASLPGRKQVYRYERQGVCTGDEICRSGESRDAIPLLRQVMAKGRKLPAARETLQQMRERTRSAIGRLPRGLLGLDPAPEPYAVVISPALSAHEAEVRQRIAAANIRR